MPGLYGTNCTMYNGDNVRILCVSTCNSGNQGEPYQRNSDMDFTKARLDQVGNILLILYINSRLKSLYTVHTKFGFTSYVRRAHQAFFWTFAQKLKVKKTKTQAQKTKNSRIFCPKLKIPAIFFGNLRNF